MLRYSVVSYLETGAIEYSIYSRNHPTAIKNQGNTRVVHRRAVRAMSAPATEQMIVNDKGCGGTSVVVGVVQQESDGKT